MKTKVSILFYAKRAKVNANGLFPIYTRITVNGKRIEMSTGRFIDPSKWSTSAGKMKGQSEEARSVNRQLDMLKVKIIDIQMEFMHQNIPITAKAFKSKLLGLDEKQRMLIPIFKDHNKKIEELVGKEYAPGTPPVILISPLKIWTSKSRFSRISENFFKNTGSFLRIGLVLKTFSHALTLPSSVNKYLANSSSPSMSPRSSSTWPSFSPWLRASSFHLPRRQRFVMPGWSHP